MDRPASQLVRDFFIKDFVKRQRDERVHDAWFRAEVEQGMPEADDPNVTRVSDEEMAAEWERHRAEFLELSREPTE